MPRMIDLEVSRVCNLSCPACMRRADSSLAQKLHGEKFCTLERFREVLEENNYTVEDVLYAFYIPEFDYLYAVAKVRK